MTSGSRDEVEQGKPTDDQMRASQAAADDLVGEVSALAGDPDASDEEILTKLAVLAGNFSVEEVFAVMVRYDTPDLLG
jgi:hypothetical protein